jgi:hypothetical protein
LTSFFPEDLVKAVPRERDAGQRHREVGITMPSDRSARKITLTLNKRVSQVFNIEMKP